MASPSPAVNLNGSQPLSDALIAFKYVFRIPALPGGEPAANYEKMPKNEQFIRDFSILSLYLTTTSGCNILILQLIL